jgi:hypothetical protein
LANGEKKKRFVMMSGNEKNPSFCRKIDRKLPLPQCSLTFLIFTKKQNLKKMTKNDPRETFFPSNVLRMMSKTTKTMTSRKG